jgi:hypothetical protein
MLGRNNNTAYVRYDSQGRIVPGGPIISATKPKVGNWQSVSNVIGNDTTSNLLRAFIRIDTYGVVPGSLLLLPHAPVNSGTKWLEVNAVYKPSNNPPTTTTTTTAIVVNGFEGFQNFNVNVNTVYASFGYDINTVFINFDVIPGSLST